MTHSIERQKLHSLETDSEKDKILAYLLQQSLNKYKDVKKPHQTYILDHRPILSKMWQKE